MSSHLKNLQKKMKRIVKNEDGQGLVEYALILVLIAIVVMAAVLNVGHSTNNAFTKVNSQLNSN
jgi:pilus assembly protein Flp/PilA